MIARSQFAPARIATRKKTTLNSPLLPAALPAAYLPPYLPPTCRLVSNTTLNHYMPRIQMLFMQQAV